MMIPALRFTFRSGAWAPLLVLAGHQLVMKLGWRSEADSLLHFAGGLAITYWISQLLRQYGNRIGIGRDSLGCRLCALACGVSVAVVWELAEFFSDQWLGSDIQRSLGETMSDLAFSTMGACVVVIHDFTSRRSKITQPMTKPVAPKPISQAQDSSTRGQGMS